jgi:hypothetical protein
MNTRGIAVVSAAALLSLTVAASAGPMNVANSKVITPQPQIVQIAYHYRQHYRHYAWHHARHYGWYPHGYYYGWNPVGAAANAAIGLATLPFALAGGPYYGYPYYY